MAICCLGLLLILLECLGSNGEAVVLNKEIIEEHKSTKKLILLNFYADWCRFSAALKPVYDKAADEVARDMNSAAVLGKIDCERNKHFCQHDYHINKYPTIKIIRNGELIRKEYRGQRTTQAIVEFVRKQIEDPIEVVPNYSTVHEKVNDNIKAVIGMFPSNQTGDYQLFNKVAFSLKDDCKFFAIINSEQQLQPQISFREHGSPDQQYSGEMSYDSLHKWLSEHCVPLVREITFQNGEELTEEGLPFLILFYHPDHTDIKSVFRRRIEEELLSQKGIVNFVTADGIKFAHPLSHLGKGKKDLPVLAIDSFRHMYVFPNFEDIHTPGKLIEFINDLHSGKLHREFHYGPDAHKHHGDHQHQHQQQKKDTGAQQQPPESTFKKLQPAKSRYTLVNHDEL